MGQPDRTIGVGQEAQKANDLSGFDLKPTIDFYTAYQDYILPKLPSPSQKPLGFQIKNAEHIHMPPGEIKAGLDLFPPVFYSRTRLHGGSIIGIPETYFSKDSALGKPAVTYDVKEAIAKTAIATAYAYAYMNENGKSVSDIGFARIPDIVPAPVRKIIHAQGLLHEATHTMTTPLLTGAGRSLRLPDGEVIKGDEFIMKRFASIAEKYSPMSHYASAYRKPGQKFSEIPSDIRRLAVEEELCESVAAYLLGFVFCDDEPERNFDPFRGREEMRSLLASYLSAEELSLSPIDVIKNLYDSFPKGKDADTKHVTLTDGHMVIMNISQPQEDAAASYTISLEKTGVTNESPFPERVVGFRMDEQGVDWVYLPEEKITFADKVIGTVPARPLAIPKAERMTVAEGMTAWFEYVILDKQKRDLPLSTTFRS